MTTMKSTKTIAETLADLRKVFSKYGIEDYEPVPSQTDNSYAVRYFQGGGWLTIASRMQPTKALNLRVCYSVIDSLFLWASRGVSGVSQGVTFIGTGLVKGGDVRGEDDLAEAYTTIGVDPGVSWGEVESVYKAKVRHVHPDGVQDPELKRVGEERLKRLNAAYELLEKHRAAKA